MKKIMLVLLRTLGDVVLVNTLVETIKNYYGEDSQITVFCNPEWAEIIRGNPSIQVRADKEWHKNFYEIHKEAMLGDWDEVLMPQQTTPEDNAWHQFPETRNQHLYDFYVSRCRIPKGEHVDRKLRMYVSKEDRENMQCKTNDIAAGRLIVIHCKSGNPFKDLTPAQWRRVIETFTPFAFRFIQVGHKDDTAIENPDQKYPVGTFFDLRGKLTINEIAALVEEKAEAFMGLDSGLSYVAATTGKPTFVWYGCTIPLTSGPWGENVHHWVSKECQVATERNHIRCHSQCQVRTNCMQLMDMDGLIRFAKDRLVPEPVKA